MRRGISIRSTLLLTLMGAAWVAVACAPLDDSGNGELGCAGLNITEDGGSTTRQPLLTSTSGFQYALAQPFIATAGTNVTSVNLILLTISSTNSQLSGQLTVTVEADLNTTLNATAPTQPSGVALATTTYAMSNISITQAATYSIPLSFTVSEGLFYWIIVQASVGIGSPANYIAWDGSNAQVYSSALGYSAGTSTTTFSALTQNMDVQLGCQ